MNRRGGHKQTSSTAKMWTISFYNANGQIVDTLTVHNDRKPTQTANGIMAVSTKSVEPYAKYEIQQEN